MTHTLAEVPVYAGYGTNKERQVGWLRLTPANQHLVVFVPRHGYIVYASALVFKSKEFTDL